MDWIIKYRDEKTGRVGERYFDTEAAFYKYWRAFPFRVPKAVERQLQKALREQAPG